MYMPRFWMFRKRAHEKCTALTSEAANLKALVTNSSDIRIYRFWLECESQVHTLSSKSAYIQP